MTVWHDPIVIPAFICELFLTISQDVKWNSLDFKELLNKYDKKQKVRGSECWAHSRKSCEQFLLEYSSFCVYEIRPCSGVYIDV